MPALTNLSFETAGGSPGLAASWTFSYVAGAQQIATFGATPDPFDGFENGWNNSSWQGAFLLGDVVSKSWTTNLTHSKFVEDFEELWGDIQDYLTELAGTVTATFVPLAGPPLAAEGFESGWLSNETNESAFDPGDLTARVFAGIGSPTFDNFTLGWLSATWMDDFGFFAPVAATFSGGLTVEAFESVALPFPFTVDIGANTFNAVAHGLPNGLRVFFVQGTDGALPAPINDGTPYFIVSAAADTFKVALTAGGPAVVLTVSGGGTQYVEKDPALYWVTKMATI